MGCSTTLVTSNKSAMWMCLYLTCLRAPSSLVILKNSQTSLHLSVPVPRHTLELLNSWFFFFFYVTVNNEYGTSSNHHGTKKSSTKRTSKTMQIEKDFFPPTPINCHESAIAGIDVNSFWKANLVVLSHLLFSSLFPYFNMLLLYLRTWTLIFLNCEREILAICTGRTRQPVKSSIFFLKVKGTGKLGISFHTLKSEVLHECVLWQNFPKVYLSVNSVMLQSKNAH